MAIAVVYGSRYGTTRQYACWIAEALSADVLDYTTVTPQQLSRYTCVVYGGALYASGLYGARAIRKLFGTQPEDQPGKHLVVFTVGLADPAVTDYAAILKKNFPASMRESMAVFHLRGGIDYSRLGLAHRAMMWLARRSVLKKPESERTPDDRGLLATYGGKVDFRDRQSIASLVAHVRHRTGQADTPEQSAAK